MSYRNSTAPRTTITRNTVDFETKTGNIYEALAIISKRANQINLEMKEELTQKLADFASHTDNLEEIFENREQIEVSRFYERLPKPVSIASTEFMEDKVYHRIPTEE